MRVFQKHPLFTKDNLVHSVKSRLKDPEHLRDKLQRKLSEGRSITKENFLTEITDLVGVRVLFMFQDQFASIHEGILNWIDDEGWKLVESPKAYSWDPEMHELYNNLGLSPTIKPSQYTSVHYVIKLDNDTSKICCEIQVRSLFEEVWGEIDHMINYPHPTTSIACSEQLKVMAKLVGSGTRLCDSIFRSHEEHRKLEASQFVDPSVPNGSLVG